MWSEKDKKKLICGKQLSSLSSLQLFQKIIPMEFCYNTSLIVLDTKQLATSLMLFHPQTSSYLLSQLFVTHLGVARLFLSHKINFVNLCFRPFYKNQEIFSFLCVLDPGNHFKKSRPASGVLRTKLRRKKFQSQIISKPFDRSPSYLVWWCKRIIDI